LVSGAEILMALPTRLLRFLKFETPSGEPIGVYVNYAMHAIDYYEMGILTAEFSRGVTSRFCRAGL